MTAEAPEETVSQSDETLLCRFIEHGDSEAFRAVVERYGAFVLSTCRRCAPTVADADDAFQGTFLVLAQSAHKVRRRKSLAAWLYGVACRVCARLRRDRARHATSQLLDEVVVDTDPLDELLARYDERVTDEELAALPEALRTPLVLRYLVGQTNAAVAEELNITVATLEGRLKRAKKQLRMRLIRRGVTLAAAVATLKATRVAAGALPDSLVTQTTETCCAGPTLTTSGSASDGNMSDGNIAIYLAREEMNVMNSLLLSKPLIAAGMCGGVVALVLGSQLALSQAPEHHANGTTHLETSAAAEGSAEKEESPLEQTGRATFEPRIAQGGYGFDNADSGVFSPSKATGTATFDSGPSPGAEPFDLRPRSAVEMQIRQALSKPVESLDFVDMPLNEVVAVLASEYSIPILLDGRGLSDLGISVDEPVTINLREIKLRSALRHMLRYYDLAYVVKDEALIITTPEQAETTYETRVYPTGQLKVSSDELKKLIQNTVAIDTWLASGNGLGSIELLPGNLVVRQTYAGHEEIGQLLWQIYRSQQQSPSTTATSRNARSDAAGRARVDN